MSEDLYDFFVFFKVERAASVRLTTVCCVFVYLISAYRMCVRAFNDRVPYVFWCA